MQDLIPQESLSDLLTPATLTSPTAKSEPDLDDLADLDNLLADSMALSTKAKAPNRRVLKETKVKVADMIEQYKLLAWDVVENIQVWNMTRCKCGGLGTMVFCRNMQKLSKVGCPKSSPQLHWETVAELPAGEPVRFALVTRVVEKCEFCADLHIEEFQDFGEVVK